MRAMLTLCDGKAADFVAPADFLDMDLFLKPAGYADYDIKFAATKMVFGYLQSGLTAKGYTVADDTSFNPWASIPSVVPGATFCSSPMPPSVIPVPFSIKQDTGVQ
jgi:hypothetical protein